MRKLVGGFDDHARFVIRSRPRFWTRWWHTITIELDRAYLVVASGGNEQMREPTTAIVEFRAGQWTPWTPPSREPPQPHWTLFVTFDDGRVSALDVELFDEAEARKWATTLDGALARIRRPKTYRE